MFGKGRITPPRPPFPTVDEFGLPSITLLAKACESQDEREKRHRKARVFAFHAYQAVVRQLGGDDARKLFHSIASDPKRKGRKSGSTNPQRDAELLARYDAATQEALTNEDRKAVPRRVAESLAKESREQGTSFWFGNSPDAIEKQLRRLLLRRSQRQKLAKSRQDWLSKDLPKTMLARVPWPSRTPNRV
jgi:hypothetical protein